MNLYRRILCMCLSAVMLTSIGCKGSESKKGIPASENPANLEVDTKYTFQGLHDINVQAGTLDLVKDGATQYTIVVGANALDRDKSAAGELQLFLSEATGVMFSVETDEGKTFSESAKYISIGNTQLLQQAGIELDFDQLGNSGYIIKSRGNSVFLSGTGYYGFGTLYSAYEFLRHTVGFEFYSESEIALNRNLSSLKLPEFDVVDVPDFDWRLGGYFSSASNTTTANRFRQNRRGDNSVMSNGTGSRMSHTLESYFTKDAFPTRENYWFSPSNKQMCFTARGNAEQFNAFVDETVKLVEWVLVNHPNASLFNLGHYDENNWCTCSTCLSEREKYGTDSATIIKWVNKVDEKVEQLLAEKYPERDFKLSIFAYFATEAAPVKRNANGSLWKNEQGEYEPIDDSVRLRPNIAILYAPIEAYFLLPLSHPDNSGFYETAMAWNACANTMYTWFYDTNFHEYLTPYNSFNSMQAKYKDAKEMKSVWIYNQSQYNQQTSTAFNSLKQYLDSKLQWNVNQDYNGLIDGFFENYFKQAAPAVRKYFNELRIRMAENEAMEGYNKGRNYSVLQSRYWPKATLDKWLTYIDEAIAAIEPIKNTNPEEYETVKSRVLAESVTIRYMLVEIYGGRYSDEDLYSLKTILKQDCTKIGLSHFQEGLNAAGDIGTLWSKWGV